MCGFCFFHSVVVSWVIWHNIYYFRLYVVHGTTEKESNKKSTNSKNKNHELVSGGNVNILPKIRIRLLLLSFTVSVNQSFCQTIPDIFDLLLSHFLEKLHYKFLIVIQKWYKKFSVFLTSTALLNLHSK